jgi:hypothetical protein
VEEVTLLGMLINRDLSSLGTYFDQALQKKKLTKSTGRDLSYPFLEEYLSVKHFYYPKLVT